MFLQAVVNGLVLGAIYVLFSLGMSLSWGTLGILNLAHGAIFMASAFVAYLVVRDVRLPLVVLLLISTAVGSVLSAAVYVLAFQPILSRARTPHAADMQMLIAGIGIASVPVSIAQTVTENNPFGYVKASFRTKVYVTSMPHLRISNVAIIVVLISIAASLALILWLGRSRSGLALRAIRVDADTAVLMGIPRRPLSLVAMSIAGGLAGLAGAMLTFYLGAIAADSGDSLLIKAFAAVVLGGVGSIAGTIFGACLLGLVETMVLTYTSGSWVGAVSFGVILLVLLMRPQGLFGRREVIRA